MSYAFIRDHVADYPIQIMCEVLGVSRSGYYAWAGRPGSARATADRALATEIRAVHDGDPRRPRRRSAPSTSAAAAAATAARGCMPNCAPTAAGSAASGSRA